MKMIIQTEEDLKFLQGKFVLQIDEKTPDETLMDMRWLFAKEKRLKMVSGNGFVDLYGDRRDYGDFESLKKIFNDYLFKHMIDEGLTTGGRFHRLLTRKEIDYLCEKIKEENY